jgi:hypothetical protein
MKQQNQAVEQHSIEQGHKGAYGTPPSGAAMIITETITGFDCANVVANQSVDTTVSVPGAVLGAACIVTPLAALEAGLVMQGRVSAANVVTVRVINATTAAVNPAAVSLSIALINPAPGN